MGSIQHICSILIEKTRLMGQQIMSYLCLNTKQRALVQYCRVFHQRSCVCQDSIGGSNQGLPLGNVIR